MRPQTWPAILVTDLAPILKGFDLVHVTPVPPHELHVLAVEQPATHAQRRNKFPRGFRAFRWRQDAASWQSVCMEKQTLNYHQCHGLNANETLVVRSRAANSDDYNGQIIDSGGRIVREIHLGDGVEDMQVTADGRIWTSYFDEGVYSNVKTGAAGLTCWDATGQQLYQFHPSAGHDAICDCYAMNVASDKDTWIYYYSEFPVVRIRGMKHMTWWKCPVRGSRAFAVDGFHVLMHGGYDSTDYVLFTLGHDGLMKEIKRFQFLDALGDPFTSAVVRGRQEYLYFTSNTEVYRVGISDLL